jgi:hypothetical protein
MTNRPAATEYAPSLKGYIDLVAEEDVTAALEKQARDTSKMLRAITDEKAAHRYAPDKWSVKQLVQHFIDAERIFTYRALSIARGERKSLLGFEEQEYAAASDADRRSVKDLADEYDIVRRATIALFRSFSPEGWKRSGTANEKPVSVRALAYATLGHERHHLKVLRDKYGVS